MTEHAQHGTSAARPWIRRLTSRDPKEGHRASTPLELLFDLCFVVAVAQAAAHLHHGLAAGHLGHAVLAYVLVFFAIWWAWMNFTWFASAYDNDDVPYRLKVLVMIVGVLVLAAGVPRAFEHQDFAIVTLGYFIMRVAMVALWLRAARADDGRGPTAMRFAKGLVAVQVAWLVLIFVPRTWWLVAWPFMVAAELAVPLWAERARGTAWHPQHIAERYGLLALIVIGESVLASTVEIQVALDDGHMTPALCGIVVGGVLTLFSMWWIYFDEPVHQLLTSNRVGFLWGYGHFFVFAATAAVGAGLETSADQLLGHAHLSAWTSGLVFTVPVAIYVLLVWALQVRPMHAGAAYTHSYPLAAVAMVVLSASGAAVLLTGLVLAALVAVSVVARARQAAA